MPEEKELASRGLGDEGIKLLSQPDQHMQVGLLRLIEVHEAVSRQRGRDPRRQSVGGCDPCDQVTHQHLIKGAGARDLRSAVVKSIPFVRSECGMLQLHLVRGIPAHRRAAGLSVARSERNFLSHQGEGYPGRPVVQCDIQAVGLPLLLVGEEDGAQSVMEAVRRPTTPERRRYANVMMAGSAKWEAGQW